MWQFRCLSGSYAYLAAGLTQMLVDVTGSVTNTYLYGNGRIAQYTGDPKNFTNGQIYTLDHGRLVAYQMAERDQIPIRWATGREIWQERFKFSTPNGGSIIIADP